MTEVVAVTIEEARPVGLTDESVTQVKSITVGVPGPAGPKGAKGDPGPPGFGRPFEYVMTVPASSWTVVHNLGYYPAGVRVYDELGNEVETGLVVLDLNTIEITMAAPMAGRVEIL